jgi:APA family basic amino acid/polyamine antiporter
LVGFLCGWTLFLVTQTGISTAVAVAFAKFTGTLLPGQDAAVHLGPVAVVIMALAILISACGRATGIILSGARVHYAMARDGLFFGVARLLNTRRTAAAALVLQGL